MKLRKLTLMTALVIIMIFTLTGCGGFDASGYVKACLDANTHGEFEEYAKITKTDVETISNTYNSLLDNEISYLEAYHASPEQKNKFRTLFADIYKSMKYEVGSATKNDDGSYTVPVTTYKLMIFKDITKDGESYITDYVTQQSNAGKTPTTNELYTVVIDYMYDTMAKNFEAKEYGEAATINVNVAPINDGSNMYGITESELQKLLRSLIDLENAEQ